MHALSDAIKIRRPPSGLQHPLRPRLPVHLARTGSTSPRSNGLEVSIGERKSCYDNAVMETWFASYQDRRDLPQGQPIHHGRSPRRLFALHLDLQHHAGSTPSLGYVTPKDLRCTIKYLSVRTGQDQAASCRRLGRRRSDRSRQPDPAVRLPPPQLRRPGLDLSDDRRTARLDPTKVGRPWPAALDQHAHHRPTTPGATPMLSVRKRRPARGSPSSRCRGSTRAAAIPARAEPPPSGRRPVSSARLDPGGRTVPRWRAG